MPQLTVPDKLRYYQDNEGDRQSESDMGSIPNSCDVLFGSIGILSKCEYFVPPAIVKYEPFQPYQLSA